MKKQIKKKKSVELKRCWEYVEGGGSIATIN